MRLIPYFVFHPSMLKAAQWQVYWLQQELCFFQHRDTKTVAALAFQNVHEVGEMEETDQYLAECMCKG